MRYRNRVRLAPIAGRNQVIPVSIRMLTVHPLPVQPDTELVHVQGRLYPRGFWSPVPCRRAAS